MSLSVFIILLITCSNLCNCVVPVQIEEKLKYPQKDEPGHPRKDQSEPPQKNDEHKNNNYVEEVSLSDFEAKGFVQQDHRKKKKHLENNPENVPQHVDLQAKNSAHGNAEEKEQTENKPENVPQHVDLQAENSAHGNAEEKEQTENKPENVPQHVDLQAKNYAHGNVEEKEQTENKPENVLQHVNSSQGNPEKKEQTKNKPKEVPSLSSEKKPTNLINSTKNATINTASNDKAIHEIRSHKKFNHNATEMDSSTLKRLVLVLVALSILFIMYLAFKTYRIWIFALIRLFKRTPFFKSMHNSRYHQLVNWGRNRKSRMMVSKYGVRTRRSDLEMRPLPLDEEEEDETVFEVGNNR